MQSEILQIEGMSCGHCVKAVRQALEAVEGVEVEHVEIGAATIRYDPAATDPAGLRDAVEDAGYTVLQEA